MINLRFSLAILFLVGGRTFCYSQDIHTKLLDQSELNEMDIKALAAFDSIPFLLKHHAHVDTTAILAERLLYTIIVLSNETQTASEFYLTTFDRIKGHAIDVLFLNSNSDIDQAPGLSFRQTTHLIGAKGEVELTDFDCTMVKQNHDGLVAECVEIGQRHYFIDPQGLIQQRKL